MDDLPSAASSPLVSDVVASMTRLHSIVSVVLGKIEKHRKDTNLRYSPPIQTILVVGQW